MQKFQVTILFFMDDDFMTLVPPHRVYINSLFEKKTIDYYSVSMESQRCWVILNARSKAHAQSILEKSPLYKYWTVEIDELFVYDSQLFRIPEPALN